MHIWHWFLEMNTSRQAGMSGPLPISYTEMIAWSQLTGNRPTPMEIKVMRSLDSIILQAGAKKDGS